MIAFTGGGQSEVPPHDSPLPEAIHLSGWEEQADGGSSPTGGVDPGSAGGALVSGEEVEKLKTLFRQVYSFATVSFVFFFF